MSQPLVEVFWKDAWMDFVLDAQDPASWPTLKLVRTVGWLVRKDDDVLSLAAERNDEDGEFRAVTHIPSSLVVEVKELKHETLEAVVQEA